MPTPLICGGKFVMESRFARHQFARDLAAEAFATQVACELRLPQPDSACQWLAEVKSPADAKGARALKTQYGPGVLEVGAVFDALPPGNDFTIEVGQFHCQGPQAGVTL
jgi:hypothetical protein